MKQFLQYVRRALQARPVLAFAAFAALAVVALSFFAATPVAAQTSTPPCNQQVVGTRFTLPAMVAGQKAVVPAVPSASAICVEGMEASESLALELKGNSPYTAAGNGTALTVDTDFATNMAMSDPSYNGSLLKATPALPTVTVVAVTDLSDGVTIWVGNLRPTVVAQVTIDQWQDVEIPGNIAELSAGTTKWSGNGVIVKVTSGAAFMANSTAVMNEPGKLGEFEVYVDGTVELELIGTVNGQRFYLAVDADSVTTDSWLQKRVDPAAPAQPSLSSTAPVSGGGGGTAAPSFYKPGSATSPRPLWLPLTRR